MYFLAFLDIVSADLNALFALLIPPPEGGGEIVFAEGSDDLPGVLEGVLRQGEASQLHLELGKQEKVSWGQVRQVKGCSIIWTCLAASQSWTTAAVWTGALSQWKNHCPSAIIGLFFLKIFMNLPRASMM